MTSSIRIGIPCAGIAVLSFPTTRGRSHLSDFERISLAKLATDPIGSHTLTLTNIVVGSRVHIETQDGATVLYDDIAAASTAIQKISVYSSGDTKNDWRIRIRKASSGTTYRPYETLMTSFIGSSSIYVSQIPDE